ncbi:hypothetical protein ACFQHV_01165 [Promicromonospora thailandica]|uniref:Uncharacterized protein n=1 Tax=Promicromonospora thailandica TaxID=765201 RepID=A0A9X2GBP5_9MICO|nr:hypothetical protein [Promicromonospora thailandica]MCP2265536.1 hypothetical protein [Promicromonospora thailandica]BFF17102.1 hypothetical protein GCM10025730_06230 [Promicromonospora thailandica]
MARGEQPELPQRVIGKNLPNITPAEAEEAIELRDERIARRVEAEGSKGGLY